MSQSINQQKIAYQAKLDTMFLDFATLYQTSYDQTTPYWNKLAMEVKSDTEAIVTAWMDRLPRLRKWIGPRVIHSPVVNARTLIHADHELTVSVPRNKIKDDQYGLYGPTVSMMGVSASRFPDYELAKILMDPPPAWDNVPFFGENHPAGTNENGVAQFYSNVVDGLLSPETYKLARAQMRGIRDPMGNRMGIVGTMLVVPPSLEDVALRLAHQTFSPERVIGATAGTGDVGTGENIWKGTIEVIVIDDLEDEPDAAYLVASSLPLKPFVYVNREPPQFVQLTSPTDPNVFFLKEYIMGVELRASFDVTMPFLITKIAPID